MASAHMVTRPNGRRLPVLFKTEEERVNSVACQLDSWEGYCNDNWLSENHEDPRCSERRVKAFLDGLAYLLLRGNSEDTLSHYKETSRDRSEVPVSSCPDTLRAYLYGGDVNDKDRAMQAAPSDPVDKEAPAVPGKTKRRATDQRATRIAAIHKAFPGGVFSFERVDTNNDFAFEGTRYHIDSSIEGYRPKETESGYLYDMDSIVIVRHNGTLHFYQQDYVPIEDRDVKLAPVS